MPNQSTRVVDSSSLTLGSTKMTGGGGGAAPAVAYPLVMR
jgi:hypothetical protein